MSDAKKSDLRDGIALCLSGGGYRAMMFHAGVLIRLNQLGVMKKLSRVSSVSGGSITAALLGMNWKKLTTNCDQSTPVPNSIFLIRPRGAGLRTVIPQRHPSIRRSSRP